MKNSLFLIGAGDLGREMESWLELLPNFRHNWEIRGYLDKNPDALNSYPSDYTVVGDPLLYKFDKNDYVLICLTKPDQKHKIIEGIAHKVKFFSYIAPGAKMGKFVTLGKGLVICHNAVISTNVTIGDFVFINAGTQIGHDCNVGQYSSLMSHVDLGGKVKIGERVYLGTNSTIIPGITINDNITIGAGAIVIRDLKKPGTYFGNPATFIG